MASLGSIQDAQPLDLRIRTTRERGRGPVPHPCAVSMTTFCVFDVGTGQNRQHSHLELSSILI